MRLLCIFIQLILLAAQPQAFAAQNYPILFGSHEIRSPNLKNFSRWTGVVERFNRERPMLDQPCDRKSNKCPMQEWKAFLLETARLVPIDQIEAVNRYMNRFPYVDDLANWGVDDYWATPLEFMSRGGDCEDYAIAKFFSLRLLGFADEDMRIVVLQDLNLRIAHVVLVVYVDGRALVLDSQIKNITSADKIFHYKPLYSINEAGWWLHVR